LIRFANVLLDLDGTLTNPYEGIATSIRHAAQRMGVAPPSGDDLRWAIGPSPRQTFARLLNTADAGQIEKALTLYRERYSAIGLFENSVYPGVQDMLASLNAAGCRLILATSKPTVYARKIIEHFDLAKYFAAVYGSELNGSLENKPDLIRFILNAESLSPRTPAMVGDRIHDIVAAKENAVCAVGVTWGFGPRRELEESGADMICDSPDQLLHFLTESPASSAVKST
jgi:phosphoglycolate phosphatase